MYRAKTAWGAGEYPLMAQALEPVSARVIDAVNVSAGQRSLTSPPAPATPLSWPSRAMPTCSASTRNLRF